MCVCVCEKRVVCVCVCVSLVVCVCVCEYVSRGKSAFVCGGRFLKGSHLSQQQPVSLAFRVVTQTEESDEMLKLASTPPAA